MRHPQQIPLGKCSGQRRPSFLSVGHYIIRGIKSWKCYVLDWSILRILVAGSSGFLGGILIPKLVDAGHEVLGIDKIPSLNQSYRTITCDLSNEKSTTMALGSECFDIVINLASQIDFSVFDQTKLYENNVISNRILLDLSIRCRARNYIFTSSNSIFLGIPESVISIKDIPRPVDMYGKSKLQSEIEIRKTEGVIHHQIIRCPNLVDVGRVGMLSILFDILKSDATLWVIGKGQVRHQMLPAADLCNYILSVLELDESSTVNLGSSVVPTMKEMFSELQKRVNSKSRIRSIPAWLTLPLMKVLYKLSLSPLGPYQMRMLTKSFQFAEERDSIPVPWASTVSPVELLERAYYSYLEPSSSNLLARSANQSSATKGIGKILTWIRF